MNKIFTLFVFMLSCSLLTAQITFEDDFEGYEEGDYVGSQSSDWTTWSGTTGGAEDASVTTAQSSSGNNSIYFVSSAANGGPQDVVLPFGDKYTSGLFKFAMNVYVDENAGAYWNFQGETAIGQVWSHNCYFINTGELQFSDAGNNLGVSTIYQPNRWINVAYEVNLTDGIWTIFIDGECVGAFQNEGASIASLDLFPLNGNSFYIDDVSFSHDPEVPSRLYDAGLSIDDVGAGGLTGMTQTITGSITNLGEEVITSVDLEVALPDGPATYTISNLALANGGSDDFTLPEDFTYVEGNHELEIKVISINGDKDDEDQCNSRSVSNLRGVTPADGKGVLIEEGTGTWCGWCPRGAVFLDRLVDKYGDRFVGVAVHNNDPMVVQGYDGQHGFTGYPGATVMRASANTGFGTISDLELPFLEYIATAPKATFDIDAKFDGNTREITVDVGVNANVDLTSDHTIGIITIEDGVTGTASGYAQSNYYSGGGNGEMGGYENLQDPVPASQMVYDHVARGIPLGFDGDASSFSDQISAGDSRNYSYTFPLDDGLNVYNMHVVMVLINPDGTIDNAYQGGIAVTSNTEEITEAIEMDIYPNPASENISIDFTSDESSTMNLRIVDAKGMTLYNESMLFSRGQNVWSVDIVDLPQGSYYAILSNGSAKRAMQFVK